MFVLFLSRIVAVVVVEHSYILRIIKVTQSDVLEAVWLDDFEKCL